MAFKSKEGYCSIMHTAFLLHVTVRLKMGEMTNMYDPKDMGSINASK